MAVIHSAQEGAKIQLTSLALVLAAALMHASWNLVVKASNDRLVAGWAQVFFGAVIFLPVLVLTGIPWEAWSFFVVSGCIHVAYSLSLVAAYERADLSLVYPIARGAAPLFITLVAIVFLDDRPGALGMAAVVMLVGGILLMTRRGSGRAGIGWAMLTALLIASYTSLDGAAVRSLGESASYTITVFLTGALLFTPLVIRLRSWNGLVGAVRADPGRYAFAGAASAGAYVLVLIAARSAPLGLVAAVRETSVVFGALGGWVILGEPFGRRRLLAATVIAAGLALLVFGS